MAGMRVIGPTRDGSDTAADAAPDDPGLACLTAILRLYGIAADPAAMRHSAGLHGAAADHDDLVRLARRQQA